MNWLRTTCVAAGIALGVCDRAEAHPPYEMEAARLADEREVVRSYVDGIMMTDPSKIVMRRHGAVIAETPFRRETSIVCDRRSCLIAASESPFALVPVEVWLLEGSTIEVVRDMRRLLALPIHLFDHFVGYGIAVVVLAATWTMLLLAGEPPDRFPPAVGAFLALSGVAVLCLWLYVVVVLSELLLAWAIILTVTSWLVKGMVRGRLTRAGSAPGRIRGGATD